MKILGAIGGVLATILAWILMIFLNAIAWIIILFVLTMIVVMIGERFWPDSPWTRDILSIMLFLDFVAGIVLATLCIDGTFRLIPLFW